MNFNIDTCKWVMWGAKRPYNSFGHIHESLLRVLKFLEKEAYWLERDDDTSGIDFENTLFMTQNCVYPGVPKRKDCFYVVHNMRYPSVVGATDHCGPYFDGLKSLGYNVHRLVNNYSRDVKEIGPQIFFEADSRTISFRWGTDLLPHEIEANKPLKAFNSESRVFNYVGSLDDAKVRDINNFVRACKENEIEYHQYGGFSGGPIISIQDHVRLIKESYLTPAFQATGEIEQGWISDRLIKNISYGQMGLTCSKFVNEFFNNRLIFNTDAYQLFYDAKERLPSMPVKELHGLMDEIAKTHTYLNKIRAIEHAVRTLENR
jgi:hypothetical protein